MFTLLLIIIYLAFISLGLPDSLLGAAWPTMQTDIGAPLSYAGIVSMIISGGTIVTSLLSHRFTKKFGAGPITAVSVLLTAAALFGFSAANSLWALCLFALPYGLGAGAIDAALNNYVALHYSSRHMSWLHCFWGVGAAIGPYIMAYCLTGGLGWRSGYRSVSIIQIVLTAVLFCSLPLWKRRSPSGSDQGNVGKTLGLGHIFRIKGVPFVLLAFFAYCALETTTGLWASSYLVLHKGYSPETAARMASLFYLGITFGRFLCGFAADKMGDKTMIRMGIAVTLFGIAVLWLAPGLPLIGTGGLVMIGLGCAPIYPSIIHATPANFGAENSGAIIGVQMACAYFGSTITPPLFGFLAENIGTGIYPLFLLLFALLMLFMTETLFRAVGGKFTKIQ